MIDLPKNKAVVIFGKKGSGKSTLAKKIAERYGGFATVNISELFGHFGLGNVLKPGVKTVIVEGFTTGSEKEITLAKILASEDKIMVEKKYCDPELKKSPNFIFCSGSKNPLPSVENGRRFLVIETEQNNNEFNWRVI